MPNTGKPSPACHLCRKRRVKCDLDRPGCLRCAKIGKACPGYREEQDLLFHNQDKGSFALSHACASQKKRDHSSQVPGNDDDSVPCGAVTSASDSKSRPEDALRAISTTCNTFLSIPIQMVEHWNTYCIPIVLHQFSTHIEGSRFFGHLDFLPDLYRESNENSCLRFATNAVAKAYIMNLSHARSGRSEIAKLYGRAVREVNAALGSRHQRGKDGTIVAVWLLAVYEVLMGSPKKSIMPAPIAYHMHCQGLASLINIRGPKQFSTSRGRNIFWAMYLFTQPHFLVENIEGPAESLEWFECIRPHLSESDQLVFAVSNYNYRISLICPRILRLIKNSTIDPWNKEFKLINMLREADALQNDIQDWHAEVECEFDGVTFSYIHNTLRAAFVKLQHFIIMLISQIILHQDMATISSNFNIRQQECIKLIEIYSEKILHNLPLALVDLGEFPAFEVGCWADGLRLIWPLLVVYWVPEGFEQQREKAKRVLHRIGIQMGIMLALDCEPPPSRFLNYGVALGN